MGKTIYSQVIEDEIVRRMSAGESLASVCRSAHMPNYATVMRWKADPDHEFCDSYARAREARGIFFGEKVGEIALSCLLGKIRPDAARVAIDGLKWSAARMAPNEFGDKIELSGEVDVNVGVLVAPITPSTDAEWRALDPTQNAICEPEVVEIDPKAQPIGVVRA